MTFILTPGQQNEITVLKLLLSQGAVRQVRSGQLKRRPKRVVGDKGYSSRPHRQWLRRQGISYTIPRRQDERHRGRFNHAVYRQRNRVERLISRLKQFRRIATRYEKLAENYLAMLLIASLLLWL